MQGASGHVLGYCAGWRVKLDLKFGVAEKGRVFVHETRGGHAAVFGVELARDAWAVSEP